MYLFCFDTNEILFSKNKKNIWIQCEETIFSPKIDCGPQSSYQPLYQSTNLIVSEKMINKTRKTIDRAKQDFSFY